MKTAVDITEDITEETTGTVLSQSDLFRSIGGKLGVGAKKGDVRLDATMSDRKLTWQPEAKRTVTSQKSMQGKVSFNLSFLSRSLAIEFNHIPLGLRSIPEPLWSASLYLRSEAEPVLLGNV
jgi:hypothetical protein